MIHKEEDPFIPVDAIKKHKDYIGNEAFLDEMERDFKEKHPVIYSCLDIGSKTVANDVLFRDGGIITYAVLPEEVKNIRSSGERAFKNLMSIIDGNAEKIIQTVPSEISQNSEDFYLWIKSIAEQYRDPNMINDFMMGSMFTLTSFIEESEAIT